MVKRTSTVLFCSEYTPMAQKSRMAGNMNRYGTFRILIHIPMSGRLSTSSITFPIHIEQISPQKSAGFADITCGPGWMLWIIIAATISAMVALAGRPSTSMGMKEVCAAALFADSGLATPAIAPFPNRSGVFETFFSKA